LETDIRQQYIDALRDADGGDFGPLLAYVGEYDTEQTQTPGVSNR